MSGSRSHSRRGRIFVRPLSNAPRLMRFSMHGWRAPVGWSVRGVVWVDGEASVLLRHKTTRFWAEMRPGSAVRMLDQRKVRDSWRALFRRRRDHAGLAAEIAAIAKGEATDGGHDQAGD